MDRDAASTVTGQPHGNPDRLPSCAGVLRGGYTLKHPPLKIRAGGRPASEHVRPELAPRGMALSPGCIPGDSDCTRAFQGAGHPAHRVSE